MESCSFLTCFYLFKNNWSRLHKILYKWWREVVTSCYHGSKISGYQQTVVLQIWQRKQKNVCLTFLSVIALRNKTVVHVFLPSFNNKNGCLHQERLFRSRNLAAMVTWRHLSLYCRRGQSYFFLIRHRCKSDTSLEQTPGVGSFLFLSHFLGIPATRTPSRRSSVAFCESR